MLRWFLIGLTIVTTVVGTTILWDELPWKVKDVITTIIAFLVVSALVGFLVWLFYTGVTGG